MSVKLNKKQQQAYDLMVQGRNVFITGGGGVGKSWLVKYFAENTYKNIAITNSPIKPAPSDPNFSEPEIPDVDKIEKALIKLV